MNRLWTIVRDAATGFAADNCLSRGAAIAYYTVFSVAPLLVIAITIAGLVFGDEAARGAVAEQLRGMLGDDAAEAVETMIQGASDTGRGTLATLIGVGGLLLAASGTFTELQSALNAIWKTETPQSESGGAVQAVSRFVRAKAAAMGLVAATGFLLLVSLVVSASVAAFTTWMGHIFPGAAVVGPILAFAVSFVFVTAMFAAVYKVLPDRHLEWRDVLVGAAATSLLFTIGKTLISWYVGSGAIATSFGAAGSLAVLLVWIYYSAQIFLFGAEFTRAWAGLEGSHQGAPVPATAPTIEGKSEPRRAQPMSLPRLAGSLALAALVTRRQRSE